MCYSLFARFATLLGTLAIGAVHAAAADLAAFPDPLPLADGYRGIWYANQPQDDEYRFKYSGGLGLYCVKHRPFAIYAPEVNKTFFCYGGTDPAGKTLLHMVSYFDHATGTVPRPRILLDKKTRDAHDNPVISIDDRGHIWVFSASHGRARPSYISVSKEPWSIDRFECVSDMNFSYPQPHYFRGQGFLFLFTRYNERGWREMFFATSPDGRQWSEARSLSMIEQGHYQLSEHVGNRVATVFNMHPMSKGLNARTNLYYMETDDFGGTWKTIDGRSLELPLQDASNPALVHDYQADERLVYLKDLGFDSAGRPIILYLTSGGYESGPSGDPRTMCTARWTGDSWEIRTAMTADNNYDAGSLLIESDTHWRVVAPTAPGPQPFNTGGEIEVWETTDAGANWRKVRALTHDSPLNHTYVRRPLNAQPDFYLQWADGHGRQRSESRLYFTNAACDRVWRLPEKMSGETSRPEEVD
ncbi:MAG: BNR-4 repeat-containing protein [Planctomycetota bacterium]